MATDETKQPGNGLELPRVPVTTPLASQVADVYSLWLDLTMVASWCREIEHLVAIDETDSDRRTFVAFGLWKAALITYRRCWTHSPSALSAGRSRVRPLDDWLDQVGLDHARDTHDATMVQAHKNVAHQVDNSEQFAVSLVLAPAGEKHDVVTASVVSVILLVPTDGAVERLADLAEALAGVLNHQVERGYQELVEHGRQFGVDKLYDIAKKGQ